MSKKTQNINNFVKTSMDRGTDRLTDRQRDSQRIKTSIALSGLDELYFYSVLLRRSKIMCPKNQASYQYLKP